MNSITRRQRGRAGRRLLPLLLVPLVAGVAACDGLLDVDLPGTVEASALDNPALARTLVNSALGQFECAYTSYVATTGILANEYINASSWLNINTWGWKGLELHSIDGSCPGGRDATGLGAYTPIQQARYMAEEASRLIEGFPDEAVAEKTDMLAHLAAYAGYAYVLLGEGYCEMAIDQGPLMPIDDVLRTGEERFTSAIALAQSAGNDDLRLMATAGRARARLDLGDLAGAAADAEQIPEGFVWNAEYSTVDGVRENRVYNLNRRNRYLSVEPTNFGNVMAGDAPDPRVPVTASGLRGHDGATSHWYQDKYPSADAPIPMASWAEAQLIIAEARPAEAVTVINRLRAAQDIPPLNAAPGADPLTLVIEERRRQLFSEGHRLNDMLRHDIPFPTGFNHKGQAWGPITCMPLPDQEKQNNPNIRG
jgi:hypothetical protein